MEILNLYLAVALLGSITFGNREKARHKLMISDYTFDQLEEVYYLDFVQRDPETRLTLKVIMWYKFTEDYSSIYVDYYGDIKEELMLEGFEQRMRYGK